EEVPMAEVRRQFETNVFGLVRRTQLVLPGMCRRGWGRVVNLSSMGGRLTLPGGAFYHATKYAVEALSDALRFEVKPFGIDVVVIEPGPIKTRFGDTAIENVKRLGASGSPYAAFNALLARKIKEAYEGPMGRFAAGPEAVAHVIERAIAAERPRTRYPVTFAARFLMGLRRWLPDRAFDGFLRTQFPVSATRKRAGREQRGVWSSAEARCGRRRLRVRRRRTHWNGSVGGDVEGVVRLRQVVGQFESTPVGH